MTNTPSAFSPEFRLESAQLVTDQGRRYTSLAFRQQLWRYQMMQGMSQRGYCRDNSPVGRFLRSMKTQWIPEADYWLTRLWNFSPMDGWIVTAERWL